MKNLKITSSLSKRLKILRNPFKRRISRHMRTDFVLDVLEQALNARQPAPHRLIHHSDRSSQYLPTRYGERLDEAGIKPTVGSVGESYDNALTETITVCTRPNWPTSTDLGKP